MSFTDLDKVKTELGIPDAVTKFDARLQLYIDAVNAELLNLFCLTQVDPTTYEITADLSADLADLDLIQSGPYPLVSVDAVTLWGADLDNSNPDAPAWLCRPNDWIRICGGCSCRRTLPYRGRSWDGCRAFQATVTAGFPAGSPYLPGLCLGATDLVIARYKTDPQGFKSESWGRYRYTKFSPSEKAGAGLGPSDWPGSLQAAYGPLARTTAAIQATVEC